MKKHTPTLLAPLSWKLLPQHLHVHLAHQRARWESSMDMNFPPWHWSERPSASEQHRPGAVDGGGGAGRHRQHIIFQKPLRGPPTLVISHSKRMAVNAAANRALRRDSKLLKLEVIHMGVTKQEHLVCCNPKQSAKHEGVAGARLIRAGGKMPKDVFVAVAEVEPSEAGQRMRLKWSHPGHELRAAGGLERAARRQGSSLRWP